MVATITSTYTTRDQTQPFHRSALLLQRQPFAVQRDYNAEQAQAEEHIEAIFNGGGVADVLQLLADVRQYHCTGQ